jgi:uncharacterized protein YjiS (DUF1127 family)
VKLSFRALASKDFIAFKGGRSRGMTYSSISLSNEEPRNHGLRSIQGKLKRAVMKKQLEYFALPLFQPIHVVAQLSYWLQMHRQRRQLLLLDDDQLNDIGISRGKARCEAGKWFWQ